MMNYILFDTPVRTNLLPLTFLRPIADIRIGILTIREKWEKYLDAKTSTLTEKYLSKKFPLISGDENVLINASYLPTETLAEAIHTLNVGEAIVYKNDVIVLKMNKLGDLKSVSNHENQNKITFIDPLLSVKNTWDIFAKNGEALEADFKLLSYGSNQNTFKSVTYFGPSENIFIHPSVKINHAILNATNGPIYLDEDSEVMEGATIRGPFYLGKHSQVKMGAKIYGPTTVGPYSKVGGELNNVVILGFSNKGHEGFLGNAVIGEWCNIGADTNNSNLKNTYDEVKLWSYSEKTFVKTGLQFCGLIMGDHSKTGINTMFNTGTVVGIASNLFGPGFQRNFIPSFSWGGPSKMIAHKFDRALLTARQVYKRRNLVLNKMDVEIFHHVFLHSQNDPQV